MIRAIGPDVEVTRDAFAEAAVELSGPAGSLLAFLLGRAIPDQALRVVGDCRLAALYKHAFPGP